MRIGKAMEKAEKIKEYNNEIKHVIGCIFANSHLVLDGRIADEFFLDSSMVDDPDTRYATVYITSDYGLCGNYNSLVIRQYAEFEKNDVKSYVVGKRGQKKIKGPHVVNVSEEDLEKSEIYEEMIDLFFERKIDGIRLVYHMFESMVKSHFTAEILLPFSDDEITVDMISDDDYIIDCNFNHLLGDIVSLYVKDKIYAGFVSGLAVENAQRQQITGESLKKIDELIYHHEIQMKKERRMAKVAELTEMILKGKSIGVEEE